MSNIDLDASVAEFFLILRELLALRPLTAEDVSERLMHWYRNTRIKGAALNEDGDMLLLQWGAIQPLDIHEPTDLRRLDDGDLKYADRKFQYIDFTRQVFPRSDDDDAEFDELALHMSITLCYGPATDQEVASNLWIYTPGEIDDCLTKFRGVPFVDALLRTSANRTIMTVGHCG